MLTRIFSHLSNNEIIKYDVNHRRLSNLRFSKYSYLSTRKYPHSSGRSKDVLLGASPHPACRWSSIRASPLGVIFISLAVPSAVVRAAGDGGEWRPPSVAGRLLARRTHVIRSAAAARGRSAAAARTVRTFPESADLGRAAAAAAAKTPPAAGAGRQRR